MRDYSGDIYIFTIHMDIGSADGFERPKKVNLSGGFYGDPQLAREALIGYLKDDAKGLRKILGDDWIVVGRFIDEKQLAEQYDETFLFAFNEKLGQEKVLRLYLDYFPYIY